MQIRARDGRGVGNSPWTMFVFVGGFGGVSAVAGLPIDSRGIRFRALKIFQKNFFYEFYSFSIPIY